MCNMTATPGDCEHPECRACLASPSIQLSPDMLQYFSLSIIETTQLLRQIVENNHKIPHLISTILMHLDHIPGTEVGNRSVVLPLRVLHGLIVHPEAYQFAYTLHLESDFPTNVYKGSAFELILRLLGGDQQPSSSLVGSRYRALLYTDELELKPIRANILGKMALGGTTEAVCGSDASVRFPSLVINEISSHYANNALSLVIVCLGNAAIRPYIQSNMAVKCRRPRRTMKGKKRSV